MMLFLFIAILARAAALRGGKLSLRHNAGGAAAKALRKVLLATNDVQFSDITMRQGLGENTPQHGCGYLGTGYDIIEGNPSGGPTSMLDPGYRRPVVALTWSQKTKFNSRDLQKLQPKQGWGIPIDSCQRASSATSMSSMTDYTASLDDSISIEAGADYEEGDADAGVGVKASVKFSMSGNYAHFRNDVINKDSEQFEMNSYCYEYKMGLNSPARELSVTDYFTLQCARLPLLEVATTGECAKYKCKDIYLPSAGKFLVVDSGQVKLQNSTTGKWLFKEQSLFWVVKDKSTQEWKQETPNTVLTASKSETALTMTTKWTLKNVALRRKQQWTYHQKDQSLTCTPEKGGKPNAVTYKSAGSPDIFVSASDSNKAVIVRDWVSQKTQAQWLRFFEEFGTHFLIELVLGGRMKTTVTMTSTDSKSLEKHGVSTSWAVSASVKEAALVESVGASTSDSVHTNNEKEALKQFHKTSRSTKTFVLGGVPPADLDGDSGFSEWANTVEDRPMPVNYKVVSLGELSPFMCYLDNSKDGSKKQNAKTIQGKEGEKEELTKEGKQRCKRLRESFGVMFDKYQDQALVANENAIQAGFEEKKRLLAQTKNKILPLHPPPASPDTFKQGLYVAGAKIVSKNKKYYVILQKDGNLVLYNKMGSYLWASQSYGCTGTGSNGPALKISAMSQIEVYCHGVKWTSKTKDCDVKSNGYTELVIKNNGVLVLKKLAKILWKTKTTGEVTDLDADKVC